MLDLYKLYILTSILYNSNIPLPVYFTQEQNNIQSSGIGRINNRVLPKIRMYTTTVQMLGLQGVHTVTVH
jgi:hypothetical protein